MYVSPSVRPVSPSISLHAFLHFSVCVQFHTVHFRYRVCSIPTENWVCAGAKWGGGDSTFTIRNSQIINLTNASTHARMHNIINDPISLMTVTSQLFTDRCQTSVYLIICHNIEIARLRVPPSRCTITTVPNTMVHGTVSMVTALHHPSHPASGRMPRFPLKPNTNWHLTTVPIHRDRVPWALIGSQYPISKPTTSCQTDTRS